jgi:hypothetical protein
MTLNGWRRSRAGRLRLKKAACALLARS